MKLAILGGHLSPALSIIQKAPKDWEIVFIGRKYVFEEDKSLSLEYLTITELGIPFESINTGRLQRKFTKNTISSLFKLPQGIISAFVILLRNKPDVVLGFGSYIQFPLVLSAFVLKIPVVIHEQTFEAGASNKLSSRFARKICISWDSSSKFFRKDKTILTGVPLRGEVIEGSRKVKPGRGNNLQIFVTGGSSGSHFINRLLEGTLSMLLKNYKIVHQTGDSKIYKDFDRLFKLADKLPKELRKNYTLRKFIKPSEFSKILIDSDLVISRGGINTVYEIFVLSKPSIVIPIPFSQRSEQLKNAQFLKDQGLCEIIEQKEASPQILYEKISEVLQNLEKYKRKEISDLHFDAGDKIVKIIKECAREE